MSARPTRRTLAAAAALSTTALGVLLVPGTASAAVVCAVGTEVDLHVDFADGTADVDTTDYFDWATETFNTTTPVDPPSTGIDAFAVFAATDYSDPTLYPQVTIVAASAVTDSGTVLTSTDDFGDGFWTAYAAEGEYLVSGDAVGCLQTEAPSSTPTTTTTTTSTSTSTTTSSTDTSTSTSSPETSSPETSTATETSTSAPESTTTSSTPATTTPATTTGSSSSSSDKAAVASSASVAPGATQTVTAHGFTPGEQVRGTLHSTPVDLGTVTANGLGVATVTFTVPKGLEAGTHTVELVGVTSGVTATATFTVTGAGTSSAAGLAYTGADVAVPLTAGVLLLGAGAGLTVLGQRRRAARRG